MLSNVYVAQEGPFNYSSAEQYGDLQFCSVQEITPTVGGKLNDMIIGSMKKAMADYQPGLDFILLSGSPIAIAHCLSIAFNKKDKPIAHNLLKWDAQRNAYLKYTVEG